MHRPVACAASRTRPFEPGDRLAAHPGAVSAARIDEDLRRLKPLTGCLRLYTPLGPMPQVVAAAEREGFHVLLGAWIGSDLAQNEREIEGALALARQYPRTIHALVVGNEVLLRRELTPDRLAALITEVRERSPVQVAYADVAHFIAANPQVAAAADLLLIHLLPYWDDPAPPPVSSAVTQVLKQYHEFRQAFPSKPLMIGETGWPSAGRARGPGRASRVDQARFVREFAARAAQAQIPYNLIEAIDQPWKRAAEGTVGGYWGLLDEWREPKFPLQGPVSQWPQWRQQALLTGVLCAGLLLAGLVAPLHAGGWLRWTATSFTAALALVFQWQAVETAARIWWHWPLAGLAALLTLFACGRLLQVWSRGTRVQPEALIELLRAPSGVFRSRSNARRMAFVAAVLIPMAWVSLTLAFAARYRDIPVAHFLVPALALAAGFRWGDRTDRREEATLVAVILAASLAQVEAANAASVAWFLIAALACLPWLESLSAELTRVGRFFTDTRQTQ